MIPRSLRPLLILLPLLAGSAASAQIPEIRWIRDPERLFPASDQRPLFLFFHREGDRTCDRMFRWTFANPTVVDSMQRVVPVTAEMSRSPALAERLGVTEVPTVVLVDNEGEAAARHTGLLEAQDLIHWLDESLAPLLPPPPVIVPQTTQEETGNLDPFFASRRPERPPPPTHPTDEEAPLQILHAPESSATAGEDLPIQVEIPGGARRVLLLHRTPGELAFHEISMVPNTPTLFYAVIPGAAVTPQGLEYYISVMRDGLNLAEPPAGPGGPFEIAVH
ncbi:hypothetical protein JXA47_08495 [Candidatus Sumerlaeota bacterium]|nr:hypothetical protein [Candidatus Sumerlaeota bacterium]